VYARVFLEDVEDLPPDLVKQPLNFVVWHDFSRESEVYGGFFV